MEAKGGRVSHTIAKVETQATCFVCGGVEHLPQDCLTFHEMRGIHEEHYNALGMYREPHSPYIDTYNPRGRDHLSSSWKVDSHQYTSHPPSHFNAHASKPSLEATM